MTRLRKVLCFLSFHKFIEHSPMGYFEFFSCQHCKRRWVANVHNQRVWEITPR